MIIRVLSLAVFIISCSKAPEMPGPRSSSLMSSGTEDAYDATKGFKHIDTRGDVSSFLIDEPEFKINGAQAGLQDYLSYETPVVNYLLPKNADYVEIIRCPSSVSLTSYDGKLLNIEAGSSTLEDLTDTLRQTDFWKQAQDSGKCTLVASEFSKAMLFHDESAPSGTLYYLVRACVLPYRLTDAKFTGKRNCSFQLGITMNLESYVNQREQKLIEAIGKAGEEKRVMDNLGREIYKKTVDLNNALFECTKKETDRMIKLARKKAITDIIGLGVSIGASIYTAPEGMGAKELFKSMWSSRDDIAGMGANVAGTLMDLTSSPDDFPKSCTEQEKLVTELYAITQDFKMSHEKYANILDGVGR